MFESLQKAFSKAKTVVEKEGATPRFYIRSLVELEDFVKEVCVCRHIMCSCVCDDPLPGTKFHYLPTALGRQGS